MADILLAGKAITSLARLILFKGLGLNMNFNFSNTRYNRQENMPEWNRLGQEKLQHASVAVIGAGGVKSTLLMSLAAAGVGHIKIIEFDHVELSNLNRQLLYRIGDIGKSKGVAAQKTLSELNPEINIELIEKKISQENINSILDNCEFIVEGGDSPHGRNLVNQYCLKQQKPMVHASAQFSYGYIFSMIPKEKTACFACLFPDNHRRAEHTGPVPVNVLSTSIAGTLGAAEVLKWFMGYSDRMHTNKRLVFSSLLMSGEFSVEPVERNPHCAVCSQYY